MGREAASTVQNRKHPKDDVHVEHAEVAMKAHFRARTSCRISIVSSVVYYDREKDSDPSKTDVVRSQGLEFRWQTGSRGLPIRPGARCTVVMRLSTSTTRGVLVLDCLGRRAAHASL